LLIGYTIKYVWNMLHTSVRTSIKMNIKDFKYKRTIRIAIAPLTPFKSDVSDLTTFEASDVSLSPEIQVIFRLRLALLI